MVSTKTISRKTIVRKHQPVKPVKTPSLAQQRRLLSKTCTNGHINHCSAKKCNTCGVCVLSKDPKAVAARLKRKQKAAQKKAKKASNTSIKTCLFTDKQIKSLGFVKGGETLYLCNNNKIVSRTVLQITDGGIDFTDMYDGRRYVLYADMLKKTRAKAVFYKDQHNKMVEMNPSICYEILEAYCYQRQAKYTYGQHSYTLDWTGIDTGLQTNTATGVKRIVELRSIQRTGLLGIDYPVVNEKSLPDDFKNHLKGLTCRTKIVYHLEPKLKQDRLLTCMQQIQRERGLPSNTTILSHGCPTSAINAIISAGFQNVGTSNGKAYGQGLYLTSNIDFAARYSVPNSNGQYVLLMCKVLIGGKETTSNSTTSLSSNAVRSGGSSSHIVMKPWVNIGTDINIAYAVEFKK